MWKQIDIGNKNIQRNEDEDIRTKIGKVEICTDMDML